MIRRVFQGLSMQHYAIGLAEQHRCRPVEHPYADSAADKELCHKIIPQNATKQKHKCKLSLKYNIFIKTKCMHELYQPNQPISIGLLNAESNYTGFHTG